MASEMLQKHGIYFSLGAILLVIAGFWWLPEGRRLDAAVDDLLEALEEADRGGLENMLAENYRDQWGLQRQQAIDKAMLASKQFWTLEIEPVKSSRRITAPLAATVTLTVKLKGEGTPAAPIIRDRVHDLGDPFTLTWKREAWKPWSWKLESVANPALKSVDH